MTLLMAGALFCAVLTKGGLANAQTWVTTSAPITNWVSLAVSADGSRLLAAANDFQKTNGALYLSANSGASWTPMLATNFLWASVAISADGNQLAAAPASGSIYTSADAGATWTTNALNLIFETWWKIVSAANGAKPAAVSNQSIYTSIDGGGTWNTNSTRGGGIPLIASSADGSKLIVATSDGHVSSSTNGGATWSTNIPLPGITCIASSADGIRWLAGAGRLLISTNFGSTWVSNSLPVTNWTSVAISADGNTLLGVFSSSIYSSTNGGTSWISNAAPFVTWSSLATSADGAKWYGAANRGGIYALQRQPAPRMTLTASSTNLAFSWTLSSTNFVLQQSSDLTGNDWVTLTNQSVVDFTNLQEQIQIPAGDTARFFRLLAQ
jgi:hypothetical protein